MTSTSQLHKYNQQIELTTSSLADKSKGKCRDNVRNRSHISILRGAVRESMEIAGRFHDRVAEFDGISLLISC
jgi:hypothetical protein